MSIDITAAFENEPPELDFIWPGFLSGTVGALIAPGAAGKSFWALEAAMAVASGIPSGDIIGLHPTRSGTVVYFAGEDPAPALIQRLHSIGRYLSPDARKAIARNLSLEAIMGKRLNIMAEQHLAKVLEYCAGSRLIVLDTLSRIHQLDENSNGDMAHLVATLEYVAATTGASVLYLHHANKGSARSGLLDQQQAARGASALIDNARWCGYVAKMTPDEAKGLSESTNGDAITAQRRSLFVRFGISKQNYGITPTDKWYQRREGGVLLPVELTEANQSKANGHDKRRHSDGF